VFNVTDEIFYTAQNMVNIHDLPMDFKNLDEKTKVHVISKRNLTLWERNP
jgi:hypothetical protein